ncbi:MAG: nitroreductase [Acidimicrobiia bacterium]|nr:nitroreductase [Acidimicrobiia bacterium]
MSNDHLPAPPTDAVRRAIVERRTSLRMDPDQPVDPALLEDLCAMACWAPNHHRTEPWRFAVVTGDGRRRLGETLAALLEAEGRDPSKVAKSRTKYLRAPAMIVVGSAAGDHAVQTAENRDATAAGVQNLLLAATSAGLASFWSSIAPNDAPPLLELCGFDSGTTVVAGVYVGHPVGEVSTPPRRPPRITWVGDDPPSR